MTCLSHPQNPTTCSFEIGGQTPCNCICLLTWSFLASLPTMLHLTQTPRGGILSSKYIYRVYYCERSSVIIMVPFPRARLVYSTAAPHPRQITAVLPYYVYNILTDNSSPYTMRRTHVDPVLHFHPHPPFFLAFISLYPYHISKHNTHVYTHYPHNNDP